MTTIMMLLVFASLGVNIAVGIYFLVLAKRDISTPVFILWAFSCFTYCLGLVVNVAGALPGSPQICYFLASCLLLAGFYRLEDKKPSTNVPRVLNQRVAWCTAGVAAIAVSAFFTPYYQAIASGAIAVVFGLCFLAFSVHKQGSLTGVRQFFRAILITHALVMVCQSIMLGYSEWAGLNSAVQTWAAVSIAAHIALCIITSVLLPFILVYQQKQKWQTLANVDELTGVYGRRAFIGKLNELLSDQGRDNCSLMVIDIDHFKTINDKYGHPTGDRVLNTIASELNKALSDSHIIGRLGGEEFAIFVSGESKLQTFQLADTLRRKVETLSIKDGKDEVSVTISIGMTFSNSVEDTWHSLFNTADTELYNAKARGRNQISPRFQVVA